MGIRLKYAFDTRNEQLNEMLPSIKEGQERITTLYIVKKIRSAVTSMYACVLIANNACVVNTSILC